MSKLTSILFKELVGVPSDQDEVLSVLESIYSTLRKVRDQHRVVADRLDDRLGLVNQQIASRREMLVHQKKSEHISQVIQQINTIIRDTHYEPEGLLDNPASIIQPLLKELRSYGLQSSKEWVLRQTVLLRLLET